MSVTYIFPLKDVRVQGSAPASLLFDLRKANEICHSKGLLVRVFSKHCAALTPLPAFII